MQYKASACQNSAAATCKERTATTTTTVTATANTTTQTDTQTQNVQSSRIITIASANITKTAKPCASHTHTHAHTHHPIPVHHHPILLLDNNSEQYNQIQMAAAPPLRHNLHNTRHIHRQTTGRTNLDPPDPRHRRRRARASGSTGRLRQGHAYRADSSRRSGLG